MLLERNAFDSTAFFLSVPNKYVFSELFNVISVIVRRIYMYMCNCFFYIFVNKFISLPKVKICLLDPIPVGKTDKLGLLTEL